MGPATEDVLSGKGSVTIKIFKKILYAWRKGSMHAHCAPPGSARTPSKQACDVEILSELTLGD